MTHRLRCPEHGCRLVRSVTKHGPRYDCPADGCTVRCWGGSTSTPADQDTRDARMKAHAAFDALPMPRSKRYRWLAQVMGLDQKHAHIGMFTRDQCETVIAACEQEQKGST